jgi:hypothetical protein
MEKRAMEIVSLNERISKTQGPPFSAARKRTGDPPSYHGPTHAKICEIQQEMARLWIEYTSRMAAAQEATETQVAALQKRVSFLEEENINPNVSCADSPSPH